MQNGVPEVIHRPHDPQQPQPVLPTTSAGTPQLRHMCSIFLGYYGNPY